MIEFHLKICLLCSAGKVAALSKHIDGYNSLFPLSAYLRPFCIFLLLFLFHFSFKISSFWWRVMHVFPLVRLLKVILFPHRCALQLLEIRCDFLYKVQPIGNVINEKNKNIGQLSTRKDIWYHNDLAY